MYTFGISVYPEQETVKEITDYLSLASKYGFTKVFTSIFSVEGTREEIIAYFKNLNEIAHSFGMEVCGDVNTTCFNQLGCSPTDLTAFKEMNLDILRMDMAYNDERDAILINHAKKEGIKIELSGAFERVIRNVLQYDVDRSNISACHNFFPQKFTGIDEKPFFRMNEFYQSNGIRVGAFVTSTQKGTHGPWPVADGLPTIEDHRKLPIDLQVRHMIAMKNVDEIMIGDAFASEEEFKSIKDVMDVMNKKDEANPFAKLLETFAPGFGKHTFVLKIDKEPNLLPIEEKIAFEYGPHVDMGDQSSYMLRDRAPRIVFKKEEVPARLSDKKFFTKGDIVMVNDNLRHYHGEVQIVLKDMENDGQRNLIGRIKEEEIFLIDYIKPGDIFRFI